MHQTQDETAADQGKQEEEVVVVWMEYQPKEDRFNNQAGHQSEPVIE